MVRPLRFGVFGSGRQGAAAVYWLAWWNPEAGVLVADRDPEMAEATTNRINRLTTTDQKVGGSSPSGRAVEPLWHNGFDSLLTDGPSDVWEPFARRITAAL